MPKNIALAHTLSLVVDYEATEKKTLQQGCATTLIAALDSSLESESSETIELLRDILTALS